MGRADQPGWNVAQRFRLAPGELDEVRAEIHAAPARAAAAPRCTLGGRLDRDAGRSRRPAARRSVWSTTSRPARDRDGADRAARRRPPRRCRGAARRDAGGAARGRDDRCGRVRHAGAGAGARVDPDGRNVDVPRLRRRRAGRAGDRRRSASTASRSSAARRCRRRAAAGRYRALVAARWEDAVARGTPVLVTQAGAMSRPILARLGFREVCEIRILARPVRPVGGRIRHARLGEGGLRDPRDDRARGRAAAAR